MSPLKTLRRTAASPAQTPVVALTQDEQRHRRRHWLRVHYTGSFDLAAEIAAITEPLAADIAALPQPLAMREHVEDISDRVHEVLSAVVGMLAESRHLSRDARARTTQAVADLAQRPHEPRIGNTQITRGSWAKALVAHVEPYSEDFATFLGRATPPGAPGLKGPSASERLEAALRMLDATALAVQRRIPKVAAYQGLGNIVDFNAALRARREADRARAALARLRGAR